MSKALCALMVSAFVLAFCGGAHAQEKKAQPAAKKPGAVKDAPKPADKPTGDKSTDGKHSPKQSPSEGTNEADPASQLTKNSVWRGDRWYGQIQNGKQGPQPSNEVRVTMRDGNKVELTAGKWEGAQGCVHWTFTVNGAQLTCTNISFTGGGPTGIFEDVKGGGTVNGDVLEFECSARQKSPKFNGMVYEKLQLKRSP